MKAVLLADNLQKKISFVNHAVSQRSQLPILLNLLLSFENGFITISATDLEIGIIARISAKIEDEGQTTVPAKTFTELVNSLGKEKITLELEGSTLVLTGEHIRTTFPTTDPAEFPQIIGNMGEKKATLKKDALEKDMGKVVFAASLDMGRPALSGVYIKKEDSGFALVATDGYRLSVKKDFLSSDEKSESILVPSKIIREVLSLGGEEDSVDVYVSEKSNQVVFAIGDTMVVGRLIDMEYPEYGKLIPQDFGTKTTFDRTEFEKAVKQGSVFAREASNIVKLSIKKDKIIVSANAPSVGENIVEVEAKTDGEENDIAFNARYLLDLLGAVDDESLMFEMNGPLTPGVFKSEKDKNFLHLIMPIRVQT